MGDGHPVEGGEQFDEDSVDPLVGRKSGGIGLADLRAVQVGDAGGSEGDPVVGSALPVDDHVTIVGEGRSLVEPDGRHGVGGQGFGGHHQRVHGQQVSAVALKRPRVPLGGLDDDLSRHRAPRGVKASGRGGCDRGALVDVHPGPADHLGQTADQAGWVDGCTVGKEDARAHLGGVEVGPGLLRGQEADVLLRQPFCVDVLDLQTLPLGLGSVAGHPDGAPLREIAVDAFGRGDPPDLVDAVEDGSGETQRLGGVRPSGVLGEAAGQLTHRPTPVAARCAEPAVLPLDDGDTEARVLPDQVVRGPQAAEPAPHDCHVDLDVRRQCRAWDRVDAVDPQRPGDRVGKGGHGLHAMGRRDPGQGQAATEIPLK